MADRPVLRRHGPVAGFSDWYNTNEVTISLTDGTRIEANIRYSQPEALEAQEYDAAGRMIGDVGRWGNYFVAAIFSIAGLHLFGVIPVT